MNDVSEMHRVESVRRDFVANVSHELKTPIGALGLLAETMVGRGRSRGHAAARRPRRAGGRPAGADRRRPARPQPDRGPGIADPRAGACSAARRRRGRPASGPRPRPRGSTCRCTPGVTGALVACDRRQMVSAIANLLDNAIKYSEPGSPVEVSTACTATRWRSSVRDHGIGIPSRDLERIFERFYRVDQARSRDTGGTGLGSRDRPPRRAGARRRRHRRVASRARARRSGSSSRSNPNRLRCESPQQEIV